ncbi:hypothetical protein ACJMK2_040851 [Sinanodonta woodiana]|uniref:Vitellogenin domain-containing protein n=1 Tax=Sinanodonta woodiana TaxID=1069815 RepID=A0ABD3W5I0_SINWO
MEFQITVFLALVATGVHSGPLQVQQSISTCSRECTDRSNFKYSPGSTYTYSYDVETKTAIMGATEDQSIIKIRATANIEVLSKCEMLLQLRDVSIESSDPSLPLRLKAGKTSSEFAALLQQYPLRFSFQDGEVNEICPEDDESSWVLNIKRGLLSAFQNTMDDLDMDRYKARENDVMGNCPTEYVLTQKGWKAKNIRKTKDFLACMDRQSYESSIRSVPLKLASNLKSLPLLKSTILCEQTIASSGQLKEALCHETHMFRPFSKENSGAATEITQKLTLIRETLTLSSTEKDLISRRSNLFFEHTHGEIPATAGILDAKNKLNDICKSTEHDIRSETPQDFAELVYIMKKMDKSSLRSLFTEIKEPLFCPNNAERTQKFFRDALPMLGTEGAIGLMQEMIRSNEVSGVEAEMWLMSLAFIHHPTREILAEVQNLLGLPSLSSKAFLPLSTLVYTFCQANPNCEQETAVQSVVSLITEKIGTRCLVNNNHKTVILALRAIGNIGYAQASIPTLYSCISNKQNPMDIRVAAVEAFRRMSCGADRNNLMALFRNGGEDSELRIAAYLAAMNCPTKYIINQIQSTLATEEVNQVSSFVWTHLTNLRESSDSAKQEVKALLDDIIFEKEFDMDKRKFSRNYESSFFLEKLGTGAKIDSNLVWSPKSFIPRSASMNLTFDLFGSSINLFEVGGRVQGLEYLLESYFGPAGYFKNPAKTLVPQTQGIKSKDIQPEKINDINGKLDSSMDDLRAALYTRVFGNELNYVMLGSKASQDDEFGSFNLPEFINKMRQNIPQEISLTKSIMLIDTTMVIPTGVGLPLNLTLNATASIALKVSGQMNLVKPSTSVVLDGSLAPSGAIAVSSIMSIDATVVRGGLKMVSTLHSSTGGKVKVELKKKQLFNLQLDLAQDKMDILDVKSKFFIFFDNIHKEQKMHTTDYSYKKCTSEKSAQVIGLEICTASFVPKEKTDTSPYFPLSGPAGYSISVSKKDLPDGFVLEAKSVDTPSQTIIRLMANTPNSVADRALGLDIVLDHAQKTLDASLATPWKRADFSGSFQNTQDLKALTGKLTLDRTKEYIIDHQLKISHKNDRLTLSPTVIIKIPEWKDLSLTGSIDYLKMKNFTADLSLQGAFKGPVLLTTSVLNTDTWVGAKGEFTHEGDQVYKLEALVKKDAQQRKKRNREAFEATLFLSTPRSALVNITGSLEYIDDKLIHLSGRIEEIVKRPVTINADMTKVYYSKKDRTKYDGKANIQGNNFMIKANYIVDKTGDKVIFTKLRTDYNFGKAAKDTITANCKITNRSTKNMENFKKITSFRSIRYAEYNTDITASYSHNQKSTVTELLIEYGKNLKDKYNKNKIEFNSITKHKITNEDVDVNATMTFTFPAQDIDLKFSGAVDKTPSSLASGIYLVYKPGKTVEGSFTLHNKTKSLTAYATKFLLKTPDLDVDLSGNIEQETLDKYSSNIEFEYQRGQRQRIQTMVKMIRGQTYELALDYEAPNEPKVHAGGMVSWENMTFSANGKVQRGSKVYSIDTSGSRPTDRSAKYLLSVNTPWRHVITMLEGGIESSLRRVMFDVKWDADKDLDQRVLFNVSTNLKSFRDFEISTNFHYPSQTVGMNLKHSSGDRFITHADLSWSPDKIIDANMIFRNERKSGDYHRVEYEFMIKSPFENFENIGCDISYVRDSTQYKSKASVTWAEMKKILISAGAKRPVSFTSLDVTGNIETPFIDYKSMTLRFQHRFLDDLDSNIVVQWGRNRFSAQATGGYKATQTGRIINGKLDVRTPFTGARTLLLNFDHNDNMETFTTNMIFNKESVAYKVSVEVKEASSDIKHLSHSGKMRIVIPNDDIKTVWEIRTTPSTINTLVDIVPSRNNRFKLQFDSNMGMEATNSKIAAGFELLIPTEHLKELKVDFLHEYRSDYGRVMFSVIKDQANVVLYDQDYQLLPGSFTFNHKISSMYTEDFIIKFASSYAAMPYLGELKVTWAPYQVITVNTNIFYNEFGIFDVFLRMTTPFQMLADVSAKSNRKRVGSDWVVQNEVSYGPGQKVTFETTYRFDYVKLLILSLQTPFPQFQSLQYEIRLEGTPENFKGDTSFSLIPYVQKITASAKWMKMYDNLDASFKLTTPFPSYPYMQASTKSNMLGLSRVSSLTLEYLPTQVIQVDSNYRFTSIDNLQGTIIIKSPFTENKPVTSTFTHVGKFAKFHTNAKITCDCIVRPVYVDADFDSTDLVSAAFEMSSPFRGYEITNFKLIHRGQTWSDFRTEVKYETNNKTINIESMFKISDKYEGKLLMLTPFPVVSQVGLVFNHAGQFPNMQSHAELIYNDYRSIGDLAMTHSRQSTSGSLTMTTPFPELNHLGVTFSRTGTFPNIQTSGEVSYNDDKFNSSLNVEHSQTKSLGSFSLITPYQVLNNFRLVMGNQGKVPNIRSHGEVVYNQYQFNSDFTFSQAKDATSGHISIRTPFSNIRKAEAKFRHTGEFPNMHSSGEVVYGDNRIESHVDLRRSEAATSVLLSMTTPFEGFEDIRASASMTGVLSSFQAEGEVTYAPAMKMRGTLNHQYTSDSITTGAVLSIPYFNDDFIIDYTQTGTWPEFTQKVTATLGKDYRYEKTTKISYMNTKLLVDVHQITTYSGETTKVAGLFEYEQSDSLLASKLNAEYNEHKINLEYMLRYILQQQRLVELESSAVFDMPFANIGYNKAQFSLNVDGKFDLTSSLTSPRIDPVSFTLYHMYTEGEAIKENLAIQYAEGKSVTYTLVANKMGANLRVTSPFDYRAANFEFMITHRGNLKDSEQVVTFTMLQMSPVRLQTGLKYNSLYDMEGSFKFTSGFNKFENIQTVVQSRKIGSSYMPNLEVSWARNKKLTADGMFDLSSDTTRTSIKSSLNIATPFDVLRSMKIQVASNHLINLERIWQTVMAQHNGKVYLDMETEMTVMDKYTGLVTFRQPRLMEFSFSGRNQGQSAEADLNLNWNKDDAKSNFGLSFGLADKGDASASEKNFHLKAIHPERTILLKTNFQNNRTGLTSTGSLSWDANQNQVVSYDLSVIDGSGRDTKLKVVGLRLSVPTRTIDMAGTFTEKLSEKSVDATLKWDADSDDDKQVGVKVTLAPENERKMVKIDLSLPSISKKISVKSELAMSNGQAVFDGLTELSYSTDPEKTLRMVYSLEDTSADGATNHTLNFVMSHPQTNTNIRLTSAFGISSGRCTGNVLVKYLTDRKEEKNLALNCEFNRLKRDLQLQISSPSDSVGLYGQLSNVSPYSLMVKATRNVNIVWNGRGTLDMNGRSLEIYSKPKNGKAVHITATLSSDTAFESKIVTIQDGQETTEGEISADLRLNRILHGKLNWRPEVVQDLMVAGSNAFQYSGSNFNEVFLDSTSELGQELTAKYNKISQTLDEELSSLVSELQTELQKFSQQLGDMRQEMRKLYQDNALYLKDLGEISEKAVTDILAQYNQAMMKVKTSYTKMAQQVEEWTNKIKDYPIKEQYDEMVNKMIASVQAVLLTARQEMDRVREVMMENISKYAGHLDNLKEVILQKVKESVTEFLDDLALTPYVEMLQSAWNDAVAQYPELITLLNLDFSELAADLRETIIETMNKATLEEAINILRIKAKGIVQDFFKGVLGEKTFHQLENNIDEIIQKIIAIYKDWDLEKNIKQLSDMIYDEVHSLIQAELEHLPVGILELHKSRVSVFNLEKGAVEFELYLPVQIENLQRILTFNIDKYVEKLQAKLKQLKEKYFPRMDISVWDPIYYFMPVSGNPLDWIPPFEAYATISGRQHFRTFDGRHFDFAGRCNYILAQDRVDKNFTIIQKFDGRGSLGRTSLVVMTNGKTVEIYPTYQVTIDAQPTDLPYRYEKLVIKRIGNSIHLDNGKGLNLISDIDNNFHFIRISGWYFNKVRGLLGTYNNEPYDDVMTVKGDVASDIETMVASWEVARTCKTNQNFADSRESTPNQEQCSAMFDSSSSYLRPCFRQVAPEESMRRCMYSSESRCDVGALYIQACREKGVTLRLPTQCVTCSDESKKVYQQGETRTYMSNQPDYPQTKSSSDIVFIVEDRDCNRKAAAELRNMVWEVDQALLKKGFSENRYGLIGFTAGNYFHHTMEGQLFNVASKFAMGLESLRFENSSQGQMNPVAAVKMASEMPFRNGVFKSLVLLTCAPCSESNSEIYDAVRQVLDDQDISMFVLRQSAFQLLNNRNPTDKIYGLDENNVFTARPSSKIEVDDLLEGIQIPDDQCANLAIDYKGAIFDASHLIDGNRRHQRTFLQLLGEKVSDKAEKPECQICRCELDMYGFAKSVCQTCDSDNSEPVHSAPGFFTDFIEGHEEFKTQLKEFMTGIYSK